MKTQKAVILCDGRPPEADLLKRELKDAQLFIAADGGGNTARGLGFTPDLVVGDMDSFISRKEDSFEVITDPDQETNDLEKALTSALNRNIEQVVLLGAVGRRLDHTLKNLSVLKQFNQKFDSLIIKDRYGDTRLIRSPFRESFPVGTTISLFPLSGEVKGISTKGLLYSLENESLKNGLRDGTSNKTTQPDIEILFEEGDLLLISANPDN